MMNFTFMAVTFLLICIEAPEIQMQVVSRSHGSLGLQALPLKSEAWYRLPVFFLLCVSRAFMTSWHCFPSVPSVEVMTCDTVKKRAMASWYVVDTSHENKHPVGVGKSTSEYGVMQMMTMNPPWMPCLPWWLCTASGPRDVSVILIAH